MAISWLRLYHDMPNDPKWRTIARAANQAIPVVLAVYVHLLTIASAAVDRGTLVNVNSEDLASALDIDPDAVDAVLVAMQGRVLDGDKLSGWDNRQVNREDGAAERAKAWRAAKKANAANGSRTQTNADERKRTPDKNREEEIREEASTKTTAVAVVELPGWVNRESWDAYLEMRRKKRAVPTDRAIKGILNQLGIFRNKGHDPNSILETSTRSNWTDVYEPKPGAGHGTFNRNHGKTGGNIDALAATLALIDQRDQQAADEVCGAPAGSGESINVADVRGRSLPLPADGYRSGVTLDLIPPPR